MILIWCYVVPLTRAYAHVLVWTVHARLLPDEPEDAKRIQALKDERTSSTLDMTIRGRLYRIDIVRMEQVLINKNLFEGSPEETNGRRREVSVDRA